MPPSRQQCCLTRLSGTSWLPCPVPMSFGPVLSLPHFISFRDLPSTLPCWWLLWDTTFPWPENQHALCPPVHTHTPASPALFPSPPLSSIYALCPCSLLSVHVRPSSPLQSSCPLAPSPCINPLPGYPTLPLSSTYVLYAAPPSVHTPFLYPST